MVWVSVTMPAVPPMDMPTMDHSSGGRAVWASAAIGGYLVTAGLCWLLSGLRLEGLRPAPPVPEPVHHSPCHWPALCHGVMGVSMGLAMLTLI
jgi:hypothetical protein